MDNLSELWVTICLWAASRGAVNIASSGSVWSDKTEKDGAFPSISVKINGSKEVFEDIPPMGILLTVPEFFPGFIGVIGPTCGALIASSIPGENEAGLIDHFTKQTGAL